MKHRLQSLVIFAISLYSFLLLPCASGGQTYQLQITTTAIPPVNPYTGFSFANMAHGINVVVRNLTGQQLYGFGLVAKLERLSPLPFTIDRTIINVSQAHFVLMGSSFSKNLTADEMNAAFDGFMGPNLAVDGISLKDIRDAAGVKLPPGQYRICFYAVTFGDLGGKYLSDPNTGCAFFTICNTEPPQFMQPVNNLAINATYPVVPTTSPVTFTWTPPWSPCGMRGLVSYELELREIFNNQDVTDAINNPLVFQKAGIFSTTFILDLNLYRDVLFPGKKYTMRVRASQDDPIVPVVIENNGYSRVEVFQFGSENAATPNPYWDVQSLLLPAEARKAGYWEDYSTRNGKDTLMPLAEFIAYQLMKEGIGYNADAIELLLSLNPEWKGLSLINFKQAVNLPVFPTLTAKEKEELDAAEKNDLKLEAADIALFRKLLDSLKAARSQPAATLIPALDRLNSRITTVNAVTLDFINLSLSELLFALKRVGNENHLRDMVEDIRLLSEDVQSTSLLRRFLDRQGLPESAVSATKINWQYVPITEPFLSFDVVVYRPALPPAKPVFNTPDLKGVFRIFYTSKKLYNNKNPEINAKSPGKLASTTQVRLPRGLEYKFWTLNMLNHRQTVPQDIDVNDIFAKKSEVNGKRWRVVLKVE